METILVSSLAPSNAVSFYRTYGPLTRLNYRLVPFREATWSELSGVDVVWIERPTDAHVPLVKLAKSMRKPVVVDFDDNLLDVPPYSPFYALYNLPEMKDGIAFCIKNADAVIVSTQALADEVELLGAKPVVIPNAYDHRLFGYAEAMRTDVNPTVVWRGTHTHSGDVLPIADQIESVMRHHQDWQFVFMGDCPFVNLGRNGRHIGPMPMMDYFRCLYDLNPAFVIVPLADNRFNLAKSHCAWLEATHAQAVCIAQDWPEWMKDGVLHVEDDNWRNVLHEALSDLPLRDGVIRHRRQVAASRRYIKDYLRLDYVNEKRLDVLEGL